ncbi:MAG: beta-ketoacyl synthase N-terminal-like domain-containing protein, partial [Phycisphaerae bacterium]
MGCLFPGARDLTGFWRSIRRGEDGISEVPESHWSASDYYDPDPKRADMTYCTRGGFLSPVDFDPTEFGIPPTILEATDTTQLMSLLVAKAALEDAGYGENRDFNRDRVSVILGVTGTQELALPLFARLGHPIWRRALDAAGVAPAVAEDVVDRIAEAYVPWQENSFPGLLGNVVAGRIANRLNLRGTNCVVDAACASSLGAIHLAMLELGAGRSDMALAGGADTLNDIFMYMCFSKTPALSPTGDARPFSDAADGTVLGEGVGLLVLKRLADAERDGDRIYAVLRGIGTSSDGRSQSIYAPHAAGQARALREAYRLSGVDPATIGLVEAHGTGTTVGDATEFEALERVYREARGEGKWCALGSIKSQIGHTKAAAGVAGVIKAALAIYHRSLPPTIKIDAPNPKLDVKKSPFYLSTGLRPWLPARGQTRRAGVSAFGFGGSNFHAVLEEHGATLPAVAWDGRVQIVALSAETTDGLSAQLDDWRTFLAGERVDEAAMAYRAGQSRRSFTTGHAHRLVMVLNRESDWAAFVEEARGALDAGDIESALSSKGIFYGAGTPDGGLAFLFPGQGSQYVNMGLDLCCTFPDLSESFAEAEGAVDDAEPRLYEQVYPQPSFDEDARRLQASALTRTDIAQPALGALGLGMARILERFGVVPDAVAGHSYGELVALCVGGRFDSATLHRLSRLRGRLMAEGDGGAMLAVKAPVDDLQRLLDEEGLDLVIANRNTPMQQVLSGDRSAIGRAAESCKERGFSVLPLRVSGAFHSRMMERASGPFRNALESVPFETGAIPVFANTTGRAYPEEASAARRLLAEQLIRPVDFVGEIEALYERGIRTFVEVGPKSVLTGLVGAILGNRPHAACAMDATAENRSSLVDLGRLLAGLAARGHAVDLSRWERSVSEPRIPRMVVPLVGANYRAPSVAGSAHSPGPLHTHRLETGATAKESGFTETETDGTAPQKAVSEEGGMLTRPQRPDREGMAPAEAPGEIAFERDEEKELMEHDRMDESANPNPPGVLPEAIRMVREGVQAMQSLQEQTAAAHQRFLEGQEQAHRSLQMLLEQQRRWLGRPAGEQPETVVEKTGETTSRGGPDWNDDVPVVEEVTRSGIGLDRHRQAELAGGTRVESSSPIPKSMTPAFEPVPPASEPVAPVSNRCEPDWVASDPAESSMDRGAVASQVVEVVCEKTGYPAEMVELEMDIEADLGVDSIKRVEIIAALEERIAGFGGIQPEHMGEIRTLNQIVDFVVGGMGETVSASESDKPASADSTNVAPGDASVDVAGALMEVVAELTGYPREMLEPDMDLEGDLGIDSIKRVEILSALEARIPDLPPVEPDRMGSLRTLGQIIESCGGARGWVAESGSEQREGGAHPTWLETGTTEEEEGVTDCALGGGGASGMLTRPQRPGRVSMAPEEGVGCVGTPSTESADLNRRVLLRVSLPLVNGGSIAVASGHEILVTDDDGGLS